MFDPFHLQMLKEGVEKWNTWRKASPNLVPDLRGADLSHLDLCGANLRAALLCETNLSSTNLRAASLQWADLNGATIWNTNLIEADLSQANLSSATASGSILSKAYLYRAILSKADLRGAKLVETNLTRTIAEDTDFTEAILHEANLANSDLRGAKFRGTVLTGASLQKARLTGTTIDRARLFNTDFNLSVMGETNIIGCDLRGTVGLDTIKHELPSSIGLDTIYHSNGRIPVLFLRGCGTPDVFLEYMNSLTANALEFYSAFISYSSQDRLFAERIHGDLQNAGVRCWFAPEDMPIGAKIRPTIHESIRVYEKLLLILSDHALNSTWVEDEVEMALERERKTGQEILFPIRVDNAVLECEAGWASSLRRKRHIGDFCAWKNYDEYSKAFQRLIRDLRTRNREFEVNSAEI